MVRLSEGLVATEGRVEMLHNSVWGSISDNTWSVNEAAVVCRQLGFQGALSTGQFGNGNGPVYVTSVSCAGTEITLLDCLYEAVTEPVVDGRQDVGVVCHNNQQCTYYLT